MTRLVTRLLGLGLVAAPLVLAGACGSKTPANSAKTGASGSASAANDKVEAAKAADTSVGSDAPPPPRRRRRRAASSVATRSCSTTPVGLRTRPVI